MTELLVEIPGIAASQYPIYFNSGFHKNLSTVLNFDRYSRVVAVFDRKVATLWSGKVHLGSAQIIDIGEEGEHQKTATHLEKLWKSYRDCGLDRRSLVVHVGGGATIDLASFASATFMRGVEFVNVPTTLLSQVDSSIGGKNGINVASVKNLVGTFAQPRGVFIDPTFLSTLPDREFRSGFAEILKHALISDENFLKILEAKTPSMSQEDLLSIIRHSCELKAGVVAADPLEHGLRKILNFGHTIGHALEAVSHEDNSPLLHGEAISLGIVAESWIAAQQKRITSEDLIRIEELFNRYGLPIRMPALPEASLRHAIRSDKKNSSGTLLFALVNGLGRCDYGIEVSENLADRALSYIFT